MTKAGPALQGVLETVLYYTQDARTEAFYSNVLGFRLLSSVPGRSLFYRAGHSVFLLFRAEATRLPGELPPHGAEGSGHSCFLACEGAYQAWKEHLRSRGVEILQEVGWKAGASFYFRDPDGNLLEIASADIWPG